LKFQGKIQVIPPSGAGYTLRCSGVQTVGLPEQPFCAGGGNPGDPISLTLPTKDLQGKAEYTFGFGVTNPGTDEFVGENLWGLMLINYEGNRLVFQY
jgi:hypothetical protein